MPATPTSDIAVGKVFVMHGTVKAISAEGVERTLTLNSPIFANDQIITEGDGSVSVVFNDPTLPQLNIGRMTEVTIDEEMYSGETGTDSSNAAAEVQEIQTALAAGEVDPNTLPAPAAGAPEPATDGGAHPIVEFTLTGEEVTPDSGAETTGVGLDFLDPPPFEAFGAEEFNDVPIIDVGDAEVDETDGLDSVSGVFDFEFGDDGPGSIVLSGEGASWDAATNTLSGTSHGGAYTIEVDQATGQYIFTQLSVMDHPVAGDEASGAHNDAIQLVFNATITDSNGDSAEDPFVVTVFDDGPEIELLSLRTNGEGNSRGEGNPEDQFQDRTGFFRAEFNEDGPGEVNMFFDSDIVDDVPIEANLVPGTTNIYQFQYDPDVFTFEVGGDVVASITDGDGDISQLVVETVVYDYDVA